MRGAGVAAVWVALGGCYADAAWSVRVRDTGAVAVVRRSLRENAMTARLEGAGEVLLAPGRGDAEALVAEDPRRGRVTVTRAGGALWVTCERCEGERAWALLRSSRWTLPAREGRDVPATTGDPVAVAWHLDALSDPHAATVLGLVTPRANVELVRRRDAPSRALGAALVAGALVALGFGAWGIAREDGFFIAAGAVAGAALGATGVWNLAAPARVTDVAP